MPTAVYNSLFLFKNLTILETSLKTGDWYRVIYYFFVLLDE